MQYLKFIEQIHNKCLKYRRLDALIDSEEFNLYWHENPKKQKTLIQLVNDLKIKELRKLLLSGTDIENMTLRELRDLASKNHMAYYTSLDKETLRNELIKIRDKENGQRSKVKRSKD